VAAGGAAAVGALPHREGGGCRRGTLARRYRAPSGRRGGPLSRSAAPPPADKTLATMLSPPSWVLRRASEREKKRGHRWRRQ
jgi:hypothetical protein